MEDRPDPNKKRNKWFSPQAQVALIAIVGVFLLTFQINRMLSSSFTVELFGHEILKVENHDDGVKIGDPVIHEHLHLSAPPLPPLPPAPPLPDQSAHLETYLVVEQMPQLIGGLRSIQQKMRYPIIAKKAGIEGRVILQFVVNKEGEVENPIVARGIGGGCDEEAIRVIRAAQFKPGSHQGEPVRVKMSLPLTFRLAE